MDRLLPYWLQIFLKLSLTIPQAQPPVGRVLSIFGDHGDQVYLVFSNWLSFFSLGTDEFYSAFSDLVEFKGRREYSEGSG